MPGAGLSLTLRLTEASPSSMSHQSTGASTHTSPLDPSRRKRPSPSKAVTCGVPSASTRAFTSKCTNGPTMA